MVTILVHQAGHTRRADHVDPAWLTPGSAVRFWVDLQSPTRDEGRLLSDEFGFHPLSVEDALDVAHHPKVEPYEGYLYVILHGIGFRGSQHRFATHDTDFFLGPNYLVTVHAGSRSIVRLAELCEKNARLLAESPAALMHRIVDTMVDNYRPEVEMLEDRLDRLEKEVFGRPRRHVVETVLALKRDVASLRRVTLPQRDVVGQLARREFAEIGDTVSYGFRDVHDHLVRLADEALFFQDRISSLLEAHLASVSNRLNEIVKVLAVIATVFMPLTVITGAFGMNVVLPRFPSSDAGQFWWIVVLMGGTIGLLLWLFRRWRWI